MTYAAHSHLVSVVAVTLVRFQRRLYMPTCDCCENPATHTIVEGGPGGMTETPYCEECDPGNDTKHADAVYETIQKCPDCGDELCDAHRLLMQSVGTSGLG